MTMPDDPVKAISEVIVCVSEKRDCDGLAFFGDIDRKGADRVLSLIKKRKCKRNLVLMLATFGGDAHAAYKISRTLQNQYSSREQFRKNGSQVLSICPYLLQERGDDSHSGGRRNYHGSGSGIGPN